MQSRVEGEFILNNLKEQRQDKKTTSDLLLKGFWVAKYFCEKTLWVSIWVIDRVIELIIELMSDWVTEWLYTTVTSK